MGSSMQFVGTLVPPHPRGVRGPGRLARPLRGVEPRSSQPFAGQRTVNREAAQRWPSSRWDRAGHSDAGRHHAARVGKRSRSVSARSRAILADFRCPADVNAAAGTRGAGGVRVPRCALRLDGEAHRRSAPVMECPLSSAWRTPDIVFFLATSGCQCRRRSAPGRRRAAQAESGPPMRDPESTRTFRRRPTQVSRPRPEAPAGRYACHQGNAPAWRQHVDATTIK